MKKLYKNKDTGIFSGVMSGLGEWLEVSPGILRLGFIALALFTGILPVIVLYLMAHFLVPKKK